MLVPNLQCGLRTGSGVGRVVGCKEVARTGRMRLLCVDECGKEMCDFDG